MIDTRIIINALPSRVREIVYFPSFEICLEVPAYSNKFLDFSAISTYHTAFLRAIDLKGKDMGSQLEPGDKLFVTVKNGSFNASVVANSVAEFAWCGTLGSNWIFHGTHRFQFLPVEHSTEQTMFVQTEEFGGILSPLEKLSDGSKMTQGFQKFNEDLKTHIEAGGH